MLEQPARRTYEVLQEAKRTLEEEGKLPARSSPCRGGGDGGSALPQLREISTVSGSCGTVDSTILDIAPPALPA